MKIYYQNPENSMKYFSGFRDQFSMKSHNKIQSKSMKLKPNLIKIEMKLNLNPNPDKIQPKSDTKIKML